MKRRSWYRHANPFSPAWRVLRPSGEAPSRATPSGRFKLARLVIAEWKRIDAQALAAQVAYSLVFAVPSLILFLMAIGAVIDKRTGIPVAAWLTDAIEAYAPPKIRELLDSIVKQAITRVGEGTASVGAVAAVTIAIWGASGGINALINACNRAYGLPDTRSFVAKRVLALLLTGVFTLFVLLTTVLFVASQRIEPWAFRQTGVGAQGREIWAYLRWPVIGLPVAVALFLLYTAGPIVRPPVRWTAAGAGAAAGVWLLLLVGFRWILTLIDPGSPYGATGGALIFLFFLRLTGTIFILGAALTGLFVRHFHPTAYA